MSSAARAEARFTEPLARPALWARQAIGTFVAAQRILLDLTAQQNALVIGMIRERLIMPAIHPGETLAQATRAGVEGMSQAGKLLLDLTASESALLAEGLKEGLRLSPGAGAVTDIVSHRVDTWLEMMKRLLDSSSAQILGAVDSYLDGKGLTTEASVAELIRQGIIGFVDIEKQFLDLVAEEVTEAADLSAAGRKAPRERHRNLPKLARQAVDEFITTQKKLLDLAIQQFEKAPQVLESAVEEKEEKPHTTLAEITQRSVQNVVKAQKHLLDLAVEPMRPHHTPPKPARKAARRATKKAKAS